MGAKSIYSDMPGAPPNILFADLLLKMKQATRSKADQVCLIPFLAEFQSLDEAFKYIDVLKKEKGFSPALVAGLDQFERLYKFGENSLSSETRSRLIARHKWIARMALTFDFPVDHPERERVIKPAIRTFISFVVVSILGCIVGLSGLVLFIFAIVRFVRKRLKSAFVADGISVPRTSFVFLEMTVVFLAMVLLMDLIGGHVSLPVFWCIYLLTAIISLFWPMWRGMGFGDMRLALGWTRGKGFLKEIGAGLLGYLAGLPLVVCGGVITIYIIKNTGSNPVHPIVRQFEGAGMFRMIGLVSMASILAPLLEESVFRGALYRHLRFKHSAVLSALTSGLIFAVIHPQGLSAVPVLGAIGSVFAILREWRGSLIAPVAAHALNNFFVTIVLVFALM